MRPQAGSGDRAFCVQFFKSQCIRVALEIGHIEYPLLSFDICFYMLNTFENRYIILYGLLSVEVNGPLLGYSSFCISQTTQLDTIGISLPAPRRMN